MKKCNVQKDINIYFNQLYYIMNNLYINIKLNKLFLFIKIIIGIIKQIISTE